MNKDILIKVKESGGCSLSDEEFDLMQKSITEYNNYVETVLSTIFNFDVWYELSENKQFPKKWYCYVRNYKK